MINLALSSNIIKLIEIKTLDVDLIDQLKIIFDLVNLLICPILADDLTPAL